MPTGGEMGGGVLGDGDEGGGELSPIDGAAGVRKLTEDDLIFVYTTAKEIERPTDVMKKNRQQKALRASIRVVMDMELIC